jgi:organic radical activating enzyme
MIKYINITDKCFAGCPFCCMNSTKDGKDMPLEVFQKIMEETTAEDVIQIEGGEPTIHKKFPEICEIIYETSAKQKSLLSSLNTEDIFQTVLKSAYAFNRLKISWNYHLKNEQFIDRLLDMFPNKVHLGVRIRNDSEKETFMKKYGTFSHRIETFQNYGRLSKEGVSSGIPVHIIAGGYMLIGADGEIYNSGNVEADLLKRSRKVLI